MKELIQTGNINGIPTVWISFPNRIVYAFEAVAFVIRQRGIQIILDGQFVDLLRGVVLLDPHFDFGRGMKDAVICQGNPPVNDNLYAQARTVTHQWIAENEDSYELLPLSEIAEINPDTYSPKEEWKYVNYLDTSSVIDGCIADVQHITTAIEKLPSRARRKIASNDVIFSTVRPNQRHFGIIREPLPNMLASTGFAVIRSRRSSVCNELIYLCLTETAFIEKNAAVSGTKHFHFSIDKAS